MHKILVAYFSATGVTEALAKRLAKIAAADLFAIEPQIPYTTADLDWRDKNSRSSIEMNDPSSLPAIATTVANMADYDVVFLGFPIWWYVAPSIIHTFLESYDFSGKTIIPFATSGSSGLGKTQQVLQTHCSADTKWFPGKVLNHVSDAALQTWFEDLPLSDTAACNR